MTIIIIIIAHLPKMECLGKCKKKKNIYPLNFLKCNVILNILNKYM